MLYNKPEPAMVAKIREMAKAKGLTLKEPANMEESVELLAEELRSRVLENRKVIEQITMYDSIMRLPDTIIPETRKPEEIYTAPTAKEVIDKYHIPHNGNYCVSFFPGDHPDWAEALNECTAFNPKVRKDKEEKVESFLNAALELELELYLLEEKGG